MGSYIEHPQQRGQQGVVLHVPQLAVSRVQADRSVVVVYLVSQKYQQSLPVVLGFHQHFIFEILQYFKDLLAFSEPLP